MMRWALVGRGAVGGGLVWRDLESHFIAPMGSRWPLRFVNRKDAFGKIAAEKTGWVEFFF
jgi:hypothetical protein